MGDFETGVSALVESLVKYHPLYVGGLTSIPVNPGEGQWVLGSLTGAVSSEKVTEERKGRLSADGNRASSVRAQAGLTASPTGRAVTKVGSSDPAVACGSAVAHRIKGTPGITGLSLPSVHSGGAVWHLDVGSSHPGAEGGPKGWAVRPLKWYASWVQTGVSQVGPYLLWAFHA